MTALVGGALSMGLASPAHAVPVNVTTTVTDAAGNPVEVLVTAYVQRADGTYGFAESQVTNDGLVNLPLEPGTYKFDFDDWSDRYVSEWYNNKADMASADPVTVSGSGAIAPVQLASNPLVTGTVTDDAGRPIAGVQVRAYDAPTGVGRSSDVTDRSGAFAIGAPPGTYKLEVDDVDDYAGEWYNNKADLASADTITVGATNLDVGAIALSEGTTVNGVVTGNGNAPLERARVELYRGGSFVADDVTDASGVFRVEGVEPGTYTLRTVDPVREYLSEWYSDKATSATADTFIVGKDVPVTGITVNLAPDPAGVVDPATVDLTGSVVDSAGKPVIGARVQAESTPLDPEERSSYSAFTNRAGIYSFTRLDPANSGTSESTYKVSAADFLEREEGQFARLTRYYGGAQRYENADTVTLANGAATSGANITLPLAGGISGTITSESNLPVGATYANVTDADGGLQYAAGARGNGTYEATDLEPGTYKVFFGDSGVGDRYHAPEWYDDTRFEDAKTVTVKSGQMTTGINAALNEDLRAVEKPEIKGKPYVNGTVIASPGVWTLSSGTTYRYEWLIGTTVVGTGSSYKLSASNMGDRITLRVTAENGPYDGQALVTSQVIKKQPKVKIKAAGGFAAIKVKVKGLKAKKIKGTVVAREIVKVDEDGDPKYKKIGKAKIKKGQGRVSLAKLKGKGKHEVVFTFTFKGKVGNIEVTKKLK